MIARIYDELLLDAAAAADDMVLISCAVRGQIFRDDAYVMYI